MAGSDLIPGLPDRGIPEIPPTITALFILDDANGRVGGDVSVDGKIKFGFKAIDKTKPVGLKLLTKYQDGRYEVENASHAYFVTNERDTSAYAIVKDKIQVLAFPNEKSTNEIYSPATSVGATGIKLLKLNNN